MAVKVYWIHQYDNGARLGIMARPRGDDWLEEEVASLAKQQVGVCVSLLEQEEISELGLQKEQESCIEKGITYINFPIADRNVPKNNTKSSALLDRLSGAIQQGHSVVIHCRMGIGRSSIIAGCLLLRAGFKTGKVIHHITTIRGLNVPDTEEQVEWLRNREGR